MVDITRLRRLLTEAQHNIRDARGKAFVEIHRLMSQRTSDKSRQSLMDESAKAMVDLGYYAKATTWQGVSYSICRALCRIDYGRSPTHCNANDAFKEWRAWQTDAGWKRGRHGFGWQSIKYERKSVAA